MRFISLAIRKLQSGKKEKQVLEQFHEWKKEQEGLNIYTAAAEKKLLIIRLDDIGDYLLFRNSLAYYKTAAAWKDYKITLLGNEAWKPFFDFFDTATVDNAAWADKKKYYAEPAYRHAIWEDLRQEGYHAVVSASWTHSLVLDDLCALATGAEKRIAAANTFRFSSWNQTSNNLYTDVFKTQNELIHEFRFNNLFLNWCCHINVSLPRPDISYNGASPLPQPYIVCFIGAATKSRRWTAKRWIEFLKLYKEKYAYNIVLSGGMAELAMAEEIQSATGVQSVAGKSALLEMVNLVQHAMLLITNNTMAAHIGVACNCATIITANGDNYIRFTEYANAGIENVTTVYPKIFMKKQKTGKANTLHYTAVTADIASIEAKDVLKELEAMLRLQNRKS